MYTSIRENLDNCKRGVERLELALARLEKLGVPEKDVENEISQFLDTIELNTKYANFILCTLEEMRMASYGCISADGGVHHCAVCECGQTEECPERFTNFV